MVPTAAGTPATQKTVFCDKEVPLNELISFKVTDEDILICDKNREAILDMIASTEDFLKVPEDKRNSFYVNMRKDIDWHWKTEAGRLTTVISNHIYKTYGVTLSGDLLAILGDIALKDTPKSKEYQFDVTNSLKWRSGDFGDHESCFLHSDGSPTSSTKSMQDDGKFYALRFFKSFGAAEDQDPKQLAQNFPGIHYVKDDELFLGIARSWLYNPSVDRVALFNGYGYSTLTQADLFSRYLGVERKYQNVRSPLHVNGCYAYTLGSGLLAKPAIERIPENSLRMDYDYDIFEEQDEDFDD